MGQESTRHIFNGRKLSSQNKLHCRSAWYVLFMDVIANIRTVAPSGTFRCLSKTSCVLTSQQVQTDLLWLLIHRMIAIITEHQCLRWEQWRPPIAITSWLCIKPAVLRLKVPLFSEALLYVAIWRRKLIVDLYIFRILLKIIELHPKL